MNRRRFLPTYHYEDNTNGVLLDSAGKPLRNYLIYGADGGVGSVGKNLFDENVFNSLTTEPTNNDEWVIKNAVITVSNGMSFKENTRYTMRFTGKQTAGNPRFVFVYTDGTENIIGTWQLATEYTEYIGTSAVNKTVAYIKIHYGSNGYIYIQKNSIMLVEGVYTLATMPEYEPYGSGLKINSGGNEFQISLNSPLGAGDYVDFANGEIVIGGVAQKVDLPVVTTEKGDTSISINSTIQPDSVMWQYYRQ